MPKKKIAFQGAHGAYSDLACRGARPALETLPCPTFEDAFVAVQEGASDYAMIPVDNTLAGRVADVHRLLPESGLFITGEFFLPIRHALLGIKGAKPEDIKHVYSHAHALPQCRKMIKKLGMKPHVTGDTAGAAMQVAAGGDKAHGAIASSLSAEIYGLDILIPDVQDADHNTTRFIVLSREAEIPPAADGDALTSFVFRVRNIPAALYKSLGGFATNGLNMAKIESYVDERFAAAQFYCEVEGHPENCNLQLALQELEFFVEDYRLLGTYAAHDFRKHSP